MPARLYRFAKSKRTEPRMMSSIAALSSSRATLPLNVMSKYAGDTGETEQMAEMSGLKLDYCVLPMDSTYTMDIPETIHCAELIAAKHSIPVHMSPGKLYDAARAKRFNVPGALLVKPGEEIKL